MLRYFFATDCTNFHELIFFLIGLKIVQISGELYILSFKYL
jgi:hypothetical protein